MPQEKLALFVKGERHRWPMLTRQVDALAVDDTANVGLGRVDMSPLERLPELDTHALRDLVDLHLAFVAAQPPKARGNDLLHKRGNVRIVLAQFAVGIQLHVDRSILIHGERNIQRLCHRSCSFRNCFGICFAEFGDVQAVDRDGKRLADDKDESYEPGSMPESCGYTGQRKHYAG